MPKLKYFPLLLTLMLRTSSSTELLAISAQIQVDYNGVNNSVTSSMFKTYLSIDLSTSMAQIVIEFDRFDSSRSDGKLVKKVVKKVEKLS